jgi:two-component system sensor histidine kinase BaeS
VNFRARVLLLIVFLVTTSTAATAWITLRQASRQLTASFTASQHDIALITEDLATWGQAHSIWNGVDMPVRSLSARLRQRIRVVTESGIVVADSDLLSGRPARPVVGTPSLVDARPTLQLDNVSHTPSDQIALAYQAVGEYDAARVYAKCFTWSGIAVRKIPSKLGVPHFEPVDAPRTLVNDCNRKMKLEMQAARKPIGPMAQGAKQCLKRDTIACLQQLFTYEISQFAPPPLLLYVGARDEALPHRLSSGSIVTATWAIALAAALSALLLSRRVLRPVSALTAASRRLGSGDLTERVPVTGNDELAELGRAFNRMAESLARSEERQRRLIADVAHELRTPLVNLRGYLEALTDGVLPPDPELFASLHDEALLQQRIVDDLQELALAESGALAYHKTTLDLAELVETCRVAHGAAAEQAGVSLVADTVADVWVHGDSDRIRQVVGNLVRNALAATLSGGTIRLTVRARERTAILEVADTGGGIAETDLPHIFERLWRAGTTRGRGGSGLGLALAREIVTAHAGTITARSALSVGSAFTVELPRV